MSKKTMSLLAVIFSCTLFLAVGVLTAADVPDKVVLSPEGKGYKRIMKGPVKLSHKKHSEDYKAACTDCHHVYEDGKNVWKQGDEVQACSDCHEMKRTKQDGATVYKLKNAFHKNCAKSCHTELKNEGKPSGPIYAKCNDCHQKKK